MELALQPQEEAIRRGAAARGVSGGMFAELVKLYTDTFKALAQECVDQQAWIARHGVMPAWVWAVKWKRLVDFESNLLYVNCHNRLDAIRKRYSIGTDAMALHLTEELKRASTLVGAEMELKLRAALDESKSATRLHALSWVQKGVWVLVGWGARTLAQWLHLPIP
jgi:hypothetical protein